MEKAKITYKGQVTIPKKVREALSIKEGEMVTFQIEGDHAILKPIKKTLQHFYGALPPTRPFPTMESIRKEVRRERGKRLLQTREDE